MTLLKLRIVPNAPRTTFDGVMDDGETLKIRLKAPPVDGKANRVLLLWLAEQLDVPKSAVTLTGGEKSRNKTVSIEGLERESIILRLQQPG